MGSGQKVKKTFIKPGFKKVTPNSKQGTQGGFTFPASDAESKPSIPRVKRLGLDNVKEEILEDSAPNTQREEGKTQKSLKPSVS